MKITIQLENASKYTVSIDGDERSATIYGSLVSKAMALSIGGMDNTNPKKKSSGKKSIPENERQGSGESRTEPDRNVACDAELAAQIFKDRISKELVVSENQADESKPNKVEEVAEVVSKMQESESVSEIKKSMENLDSLNKEGDKTIHHRKEGIALLKCKSCGELKIFKTREHGVYHCPCGAETPYEDFIKVRYACVNCGFHGFLNAPEGMDISEGVKCRQCESPIDLKLNTKTNTWESL